MHLADRQETFFVLHLQGLDVEPSSLQQPYSPTELCLLLRVNVKLQI